MIINFYSGLNNIAKSKFKFYQNTTLSQFLTCKINVDVGHRGIFKINKPKNLKTELNDLLKSLIIISKI
jgi:hypothetical protein